MNAEETLAIDLPGDAEAQVAILNTDGGLIIITFALRAHRGALTAILPPGGVVRQMEDTGEVKASWGVQ